MKKIIKSLSLFIALLLLFTAVSGASALGAKTTIEEWTSRFEAIKTDTSIIALTPGSNEHEMNFAWLSALTDLKHEFKLSENIDMRNSVSVSVKSSIGVTGSFSNKSTAADLKPNTVYYYSYTENGVWSNPEAFKTGGGSNFKAILVADTQIGRSGDEKLDEVLIRDSFGWNSTLETAFAANPDINFILSAGDQINTAYTNLQFNAFLAPKILRNIPIATTMGNHDFYFPLYKNHFNNPNEFKNEIIESPGGSGYWFTYGQALFIVVNSNMPFPANQELLVKQAVAANPDAVWRVVLMHNSIYGAGGGEPNPVNLWRFYAPVFDKYKIDLVLSGHDHVHCRTYPINNGKIVDNGKGVVYLSENSSSGSKFSDAPATAPLYATCCSQLRAPTYSVLAFEEGSLTINTYRTDTLEKIDEEYVMEKESPAVPMPAQSFFETLAGIISSLIMVLKASF